MAYVALRNFGRGSPATADDIQSQYNDLQTASAAIRPEMFAPNAGIAESFINFGGYFSTTGHKHLYTGLGRRVLGDEQMRRATETSAATPNQSGVPIAFAAAPGTLCLWGRSEVFDLYFTGYDWKYEGRLEFQQTTPHGERFLPGTAPFVFPGLIIHWSGAISAAGFAFLTKVLSVDSEGFTFQVAAHEDISFPGTMISAYLTYIAFGTAPGLVVEPTVVARG